MKKDKAKGVSNNRIIKVSELIREYLVHSALDLRYPGSTIDGDRLVEAQLILDPQIKQMEELVEKQCQEDQIDEEAVNHLRWAQMKASYVIGLIAGLHLAGRCDRVPEIAKVYDD